MYKYFLLLILILNLAALAACSFRPLSPEQRMVRQDYNACASDANAMVGSEYRQQLAWSSYFEWCMKGKGYTSEQLRQMWY